MCCLQVLPSVLASFEEDALRACELVLAGDPRIGKIPGGRKKAQQREKLAKTKRRSLKTK